MSVEDCVFRSYNPKRAPSRRWMSWHNHTGAFPRFSFCPTPGLSIGRYKAALEGADADAWEGFAITEHAFGIAIPDAALCWPHVWYNDTAVLDRCIADGTRDRRIRECLEYYKSFCGGGDDSSDGSGSSGGGSNSGGGGAEPRGDGKRFESGIEVEVNADGVAAIPFERLREFGGVVIASVHHAGGEFSSWAERHFFHLARALRIPADIAGHPVRGMSKYSSPANPLPKEIIDETLDMIRAAGMAVEINAHYPQLHDDVHLLQGAAERGMGVAFSMDLHYPEEFGNWRYFEDVAELAGVDLDKMKLFQLP